MNRAPVIALLALIGFCTLLALGLLRAPRSLVVAPALVHPGEGQRGQALPTGEPPAPLVVPPESLVPGVTNPELPDTSGHEGVVPGGEGGGETSGG